MQSLYPLAEELRNKYGSDFKYVVLVIMDTLHHILGGEKKILKAELYMEPDAPNMLTLKMIKGKRAGLKDPYSIMLSASAAKAIFGDEDPMEKAMKIDNKMDVKVTGVYEDLPAQYIFQGLKFIAALGFICYHNHG